MICTPAVHFPVRQVWRLTTVVTPDLRSVPAPHRGHGPWVLCGRTRHRHSLVVMCSSDDRTQFNAVCRFVGLLCCDETFAGIPADSAPFLFTLSRLRLQTFTNIPRFMFSFRSQVTRQRHIHGTGLPLRAKIRVVRSLRTSIHVTRHLMYGAEIHNIWQTTVSQRWPHSELVGVGRSVRILSAFSDVAQALRLSAGVKLLTGHHTAHVVTVDESPWIMDKTTHVDRRARDPLQNQPRTF